MSSAERAIAGVPVIGQIRKVNVVIKATDKAIDVYKALKPLKVGNFASKEILKEHFAKHAKEFLGKFRNAEEYAKGAQDFFKRVGDDIVQYTRKNGDIVKYDIKNNIFGVVQENGTIRTMFKPDEGLKYFKGEAVRDLGEKKAKAFDSL